MLNEINKIHSVAVIGSRGQMGGFLALRAERAGFKVHRFDQPLCEEDMSRLLPKSDLVLLCVPITVMQNVLEKIVPLMREDSILSDVVSVKERPLDLMMRAFSGSVVGTHPLYGPNIPADFTPTTAVVAGRDKSGEAANLVKDFFDKLDLGGFISTGEEHDRAMAMIQALNFSSSIAYFACARELPNIEKYITPSFKRRMESASKMVTEDSDLFTTISEANQYSQESIRLFRSFLSLAASGDMDLLAERASWWWQEQST